MISENILFGNKKTKGRPPKIKSKKQGFSPLSVDPYPPNIKREVLIWDNFDFFLPPTLLIEKGTFLKKIGLPSTFIEILKGIKIGVKIIFHPFYLNLSVRDTVSKLFFL